MAENVVKYLDLNGLKALYGVVDGKISGAKTELLGGATKDYNTLGKLEGKIKDEVTRATGAEQALDTAIKAMDLTDTAVSGQFITAVHQTDGKVTVERGGVSASMVTATNVEAGAGTVAITGANVAEQIKSLGQTLKAVEGNAAKYRVVTLTADEIAGLSGVVTANVDRAYKVVSYTGEWDTATNKSQVGEAIIIYKDSALESVTASGDENTVITFKYKLADGTPKTVSVDLGKAIFESEMGNGMQVDDSKIAIKLDAANDGDFLTVGADGLKLSGVKEAIKTAVDGKNVSAEGDGYITATADGNKVSVKADVQGLTVATHEGADSTIAGVEKSLVDGKEVADKVAAFTNARIGEEIAKLDSEKTSTGGVKVTVKVTEADGKISAVNVTETDIASDAALTDEISRAKAAENKIEASVGLDADGSFTTPAGKNYINGAATVMDAVEKLDVQAKANADKIAGMSVDEDNKTVTIKSKSLQFVAYTPQEIQDAAKQSA